MGDKDGVADGGGGGGEVPVPARPVRMSLSQVKAGKLQKRERRSKARSADAMNTSRDFFFSEDRSSSASGSSGSTTGKPTRLVQRSVSFSDETHVCRTVADETLAEPGKTAPGRPSTAAGMPIFNSRGEMQVESDDSEDECYADGETQAVLCASSSAALSDRARNQKRAAACNVGLHPTVSNILPGSPDSMATSTSSLESVKDVAAAEKVGMIQADWMEVADSRYAGRADFQRLEVCA